MGPNPNGQHTVLAKKQTVQQEVAMNGYTGLSLISAEALCQHYLDYEAF